ncbi:hypothetical protein FSARC_8775 [Fusarium sarcochroum]|uniref:Zn(2)-C6 fungal-type domain-containing protein n=1 Tax=Fusarium sarcochroum TaxID=1208366 RepID=A0A8H4X5Y4_9HYPO|nr:hypothetical protein FSARC_8775 [Fusarium sarcochroum]
MESPSPSLSTHRAAVSRPSSTYARKRAVKACQVCRARRTKCDQKRPVCSFCAKAGVECVFEPDEKATFDQASLAIIDRLDRLERKIDAQSTVDGGRNVNPNTLGSLKIDRIHEQVFPVTLGRVLEWQVFQDIASPTTTTSSPFTEGLISQSVNQQRPWLGDVLDRPACDRWLDNFFAHVHVKNPILDEAEIRRLVCKLCAYGPEWDIASGLALLVCANGVLARPLHESLPVSNPDRQIAIALFNAALKRTGIGLNSVGLIQAQCAFLSGVLLMSLLRPTEAWMTFVQGLAICQTFPSIRRLHSGSDQVNSAETVSEQSIYWSCWKSEQELRFELGMHSSGGLADEPPQLFPNPPEGCEGSTERAWYFYLSEISLWRLEVNARQAMDKLEHNDWPGLSQALGEIKQGTINQLEAWKSSLPPLVDIGSNKVPEEDDVVRFVLRGRVTYVHELISWPFLFAAMNDGLDHPVPDKQIVNALAFHHNRLIANAAGYYHRHHGTWLMLRSSARSACILLGFARLYPNSVVMPPAWEEAIFNVLKMVEYWSAEVEEMRLISRVMTRLLESLQ